MNDLNQQNLKVEQIAEVLYAIANGKKDAPQGVQAFKNNPTQTSPTLPTATGNGGLFATAGVDPQMFSAVIRANLGLSATLPVMPQGSAAPTDASYGGYESPLYTTIGAITDATTVTRPTDPCDDQPSGGLIEACTLTAQYGRVGRGFNISMSQLGRLQNRGEPTDLRVLNSMLSQDAPFMTPSVVPNGAGNIITNLWYQRMMIAATNLQRDVASMVWTGDPSNDTSGGGYKEFMGLETLVNSGNKVDINGAACAFMDADIKDFGYDMVNGSGRDVVQYLDAMIHYLEDLAINAGLTPVDFRFVMRENVFDEVVKVWALRYYNEYLTQINNVTTNGRVILDGAGLTNFRDEMRNGRFLVLRGRRYPVIIDNSIPEKTNITNSELGLGQYASDIYVVPFSVLGGSAPTLYWEFFNQANGMAELVRQQGGVTTNYTTDGGMFVWNRRELNGCIEWDFATEPRIILRTPYLSGRLQNVGYEPLQHTRDYNPDSAYFFQGGVTNTPIQQVYTEWSNNTPVTIG